MTDEPETEKPLPALDEQAGLKAIEEFIEAVMRVWGSDRVGVVIHTKDGCKMTIEHGEWLRDYE